MRKLSSVVIVASFMLALLPVVAFAHTENAPFPTDLIADGGDPLTAIVVGDVQVWNDGTDLYVTYDTTLSGWVMTETHLYVGSTPPDKSAPGRFPYKEGGPTYVIPLADLGVVPGDMLCIAAQAVVQNPTEEITTTVVSDTNVEWSADGIGGWNPTFACFVHSGWPNQFGPWIWRTALTNPNDEYATVPLGGWFFRRVFTIPGSPIAGDIEINADNAFTLEINGTFIGGDGTMSKDGPDTQQWKSPETYGLTNLDSGENTILICALNYHDSTHNPGGTYPYGDGTMNPAGLIFELEITSVREESAWGEGAEIREGKEWAMYFNYTIQ